MSIKAKAAIIIIGIFLVFGSAEFGIQRFIILPSYLALEEEEAVRDAHRVEEAVRRDIRYLDSLTSDWSAWDDTYAFIETQSADYIASNLPFTTFKNNNLNLLYICDTGGKVVWGKIHDLESETEITLQNMPRDRLPETHPLLSAKFDNTSLSVTSVSGIYMTPNGPLLISSRPILTSGNRGPSRGFFIMGRFLTASMRASVAAQTDVDFQIFPAQGDSMPDWLKTVSAGIGDRTPYVIETGTEETVLKIYTAYPDIYGNKALVIESKIPRKIIVRGVRALRYALLSLLIVGTIALIGILLLLQWAVLKPILQLTGRITAAAQGKYLPGRPAGPRRDEIGILEREYDALIARLEQRSAELKALNVKLLLDIDRRQQVEKELRESGEKIARLKKMESLGLLAGSVAHDLNNVLSGIVTYPELLLMDLPEDSRFRKPLETIQKSGKNAAAIVRDLLTVARGAAVEKQPLNLNEVIRGYLASPEYLKLMQYHPAVTVRIDLDLCLLNIKGSSIHMGKIVMNLVSNATEAVLERGEVVISTQNRFLERPLKGYNDIASGEYVILTVKDDGPGISSQDLERIFEPFYSKKVLGRSGTGLGLAIVWNTVQDHNGYIDVKTDRNGTAFDLFFPITREELWKPEKGVLFQDYQGGGETVLVVDDLESQREILCKMLDILGYRGTAVSSGEAAFEYLKEHRVDLIVLDMIMDSGMNGRETYEKIIEMHPRQKALILSGFSETEDVKRMQRLGAGRYLNKPIELEKLGLAIREAFAVQSDGPHRTSSYF
ncbi:MAG: CHASE4 domain-containing protein [Pseudomonadota bacterium]